MIIKVNKETLSNAVQPLLGAVSNKNTLAAVEGILITTNGDDACTLTSFDLEKGYRIKIPVKVLEIKLGAFGEIKIIPAAAIPLYRRTKHSTRRNPK